MRTYPYNHRGIAEADVDLDRPGAWLPLLRVQPGRGGFSSAELRVDAPGGRGAAFAFLTGERTSPSVELREADTGVLAVTRDLVEELLTSADGRQDRDPAVIDLTCEISRRLGAGRAPQVERMELRLRVAKTPAPPKAVIEARPADLGVYTRSADVPLLAIALSIGPDVRFAAGALTLDLDLDLGSLAGAYDWRVRPDDTTAALFTATRRVEAQRGLLGFGLTVENADALKDAKEARFLLALPQPEAARLLEALGVVRARLSEAVVDTFVRLRGYTRGGRGAPDAPVAAEGQVTLRVALDTEPWVTLTLGADPVRLVPGEEGSRRRLGEAAVRVTSEGERLHLARPRPAFRVGANVPPPKPALRWRATCMTLAAGPARLELGPRTVLWRSEGAADVPLEVAGPFAEGSFEPDLTELWPALETRLSGARPSELGRLDLVLRFEASIVGEGGLIDRILPPADLAIRLQRARRRWPICIDLGTSATSVWIGDVGARRAEGAGFERLQVLPLGERLAEIDKLHFENRTVSRTLSLIPSHVGLSSTEHMRARYRPSTLGDLALGASDDDTVARRLAHFGRSYDVSVPFPNSEAIARHISEIVFDLKTAVSRDQREILLPRPVAARDPRTGKLRKVKGVDVGALLCDYFDELMTFYVVRHVTQRVMEEDEDLTELLADPRLIITHPCGIGTEQARYYEAATAKLAAKLLGGGPADEADPGRLVLIPESVAAARYAVARLLDGAEVPDAGVFERGATQLILLDIGAGTTDVSVVRFETAGGSKVPKLEVLLNFGIPVGGDRLDDALARRIARTLEAMARDPEMRRLFDVALSVEDLGRDLPSAEPDLRARILRFRRELKTAKARLSQDVFDAERRRPPGERAYRWREGEGPRLPLRLRVFDAAAGDGVLKPAAGRPPEGRGGRIDTVVDGLPLSILALPSEDPAALARGLDLWLELPPEAFAPQDTGETASTAEASLADVMTVIGQVVPEMALTTAVNLDASTPTFACVTGRTALWPPLYAAIERTITSTGRRVAMATKLPFDADDMKRCVVSGASLLANETTPEALAPRFTNPIALAELEARPGVEGDAGTITTLERVVRLHYVTDFRGTPRRDVDLTGAFHVVRAVPGVSERRLPLLARVLGTDRPFVRLRGISTFEPHDFGLASLGKVRVAIAAHSPRDVDVEITPAQGGARRTLVVRGDQLVDVT